MDTLDIEAEVIVVKITLALFTFCLVGSEAVDLISESLLSSFLFYLLSHPSNK
jgi:hypothetical protein